jgi:hypothetical protein
MSSLDNTVASPFPEHANKIIYNFQEKLINIGALERKENSQKKLIHYLA